MAAGDAMAVFFNDWLLRMLSSSEVMATGVVCSVWMFRSSTCVDGRLDAVPGALRPPNRRPRWLSSAQLSSANSLVRTKRFSRGTHNVGSVAPRFPSLLPLDARVEPPHGAQRLHLVARSLLRQRAVASCRHHHRIH